MADTVAQLPVYADEKHVSDDSIEKKSVDESSIDDALKAKEVEEFEERLANDEASEDEYRVEEAYEVAIKVCIAPIICSAAGIRCSIILTMLLAAGLVAQGRPHAPGGDLPHPLPRSWFLSIWSVSDVPSRISSFLI